MFFLETSVPTSEPASAMTYNINSVESSSVTDMFEEDNFDLLTQSSELPGSLVPEVPIANCNLPPAAKKRKVSTQDIQKMQLEVLALEKKKIEMELENMQLANQKLKLEIQEMLARSQPVSLVIEIISNFQ